MRPRWCTCHTRQASRSEMRGCEAQVARTTRAVCRLRGDSAVAGRRGQAEDVVARSKLAAWRRRLCASVPETAPAAAAQLSQHEVNTQAKAGTATHLVITVHHDITTTTPAPNKNPVKVDRMETLAVCGAWERGLLHRRPRCIAHGCASRTRQRCAEALARAPPECGLQEGWAARSAKSSAAEESPEL